GFALALLLFRRRSKGRGRLLDASVLVLHSVPTFWLGIVLVAVFSYGLGILPSSQMHAPGAADSGPGAALRHLLLPAITLGLSGAPTTARHLAASLSAVDSQEFVRTARAKGLSDGEVVLRHELRPALLPIVTLLGLSLPVLFSGTLVVEVVFSWPGM